MAEVTQGGVTVANVTATGATVSWTTPEPNLGLIAYGTETATGASTPLDGVMGTSHSKTLVNLKPATKYFMSVQSTDINGKVTSVDGTFTTLAAPAVKAEKPVVEKPADTMPARNVMDEPATHPSKKN